MNVYVINVDSAVERWSRMQRMAAEFGLAFTRVSARTPDHPDVVDAFVPNSVGLNGTIVSAGAVACLKSHRSVWHRIVEIGERAAIILEDDICIARSFVDLAGSLNWFPDDADIVKLETTLAITSVDLRSRVKLGGREMARLVAPHLGTAAYALSSAGAAKALELTRSAHDHVDQVLFRPQSSAAVGLSIYQMLPAPCVQGIAAGLDDELPFLKSSLGHDPAVSADLRRKEMKRPGVTRRMLRQPRKVLVKEIIQGKRIDVVPFG